MLPASSSSSLSGPITRHLDEEEMDATELKEPPPDTSGFQALQVRQERISQLMQQAIENLISQKESVCLLEEDDFAYLRAAPGEHSDEGRIFTQYWSWIHKTENGFHSFQKFVKLQKSKIEELMQYFGLLNPPDELVQFLGSLIPADGTLANDQQLVGRLHKGLQKLDGIEKRDYRSLLGENEIDSSATQLENQYFFARLQLVFHSHIKHVKHQLIEIVIRLLKKNPDSSCNPNDLERLIPVETEYDQAVISTYQREMRENMQIQDEDLNVEYFVKKLRMDRKTEIDLFNRIASKSTLAPDSSAPQKSTC